MHKKPLLEDWEFNVLGIYNYRKPGMLQYYFDFLIENHSHIRGDIVEAGVYKGRSILAVGLLLKELGSDKRVFGYDSWSGFPPIYHDADDYSQWDKLHACGAISADHYDKIKRLQEFRSLELKGQEVTAANASLSGDFSGCSLEVLTSKIEYLGLDNIVLIPGEFKDTMQDGNSSGPCEIMALLMDCDLYGSYMTTFEFVWPRMARGGYIFLDEYYSLKFPAGRIATDEFFLNKRDKPQRHKQILGDFERWFVRKLE